MAGSLAFWAWNDRRLWFFGDEWDFLARRGLSYPPASRRSIWFPHNEHWSTLPILLWRGLFSAFHLSSYWPYLAPLLLAGTAVAHLAWRLARKAGADPWVATFAAGLLAFSGAGAEDMTSAFQVTFVASVLFGLLALVVLDAPQTSLRDGVVSLSLLASLMCSTVGDAMVVGAGVVLAARRPVRRALLTLALPVASYAIWFAFLGRPAVSAPGDHFTLNTFTTAPSYVLFGVGGALGHSAGFPNAGPVLLTTLAAWIAWRARALWEEAPVLLGLSLAVLSFYVLAALGRDRTAGAFIVVSRYVWVAMALLVPVIARALSPRPGAPGSSALRASALGLLAATAFAGIGPAESWVAGRDAVTSALKRELAGVADLVSAGVPDVSGPDASPVSLYPDLSVAGIGRLASRGYLSIGPATPSSLAKAREVLALGTWNGSRTALTADPLFADRFTLLRSAHAVVSPTSGCFIFDPALPRQPVQIWLRAGAGRPGASAEIVSTPTPAALNKYISATLVWRGEQAPAPVSLMLPADGHGYLDDSAPGTDVVLRWNAPVPVELCAAPRAR